ncbi:Serine/threonine-protein phosphatase 6 regulatory ankyrin repeat subunit C [Balamuthia mandrillaris]
MDADLLKKDKMGRTGLHFASMYGHWHLLSIMLDEDISVLLQTDNQKRGALHLATLNKHERCVEELINLGANVVKKDIEGRSALSMAAELGAVGIAEWLLSCIEQDRKEEDDDAYDDEDDDESSKEGGGIDSRDLEGRTPFHWAAACGHTEVLLLLHQYKCDVNAQDRNGATALHLACLNSRRTCVDSLVAECFVELDLVDKHGRTVLHSAAAGTHSEGKACLELLLSGIQLQFPNLLNVQDDRGWTCLHWACFRNNAKSVALLLKYGVDHALSDYQQHNTCLHVASFHGYTKCVVALLKATRDFAFLQALNANQDTAVHLAAANGHLDTLKELCTDWTRHVEYILEQQPQQSENGSPSSPFLRSSIVRQLNRQGSTALHLVARRGHRECLMFCLEELKTHSWLLDDGDDLGIYGNDENGEEDDDESVNNHKDFGVVEGNYPELEKGLYQKDNRGRTVFHEVCRGGHLSCLEQLLTLIRGQTRDTSFAAKQKESVGLEVLLDRDKDGRTPLHLATASSASPPSPSSSSDDETGAAGVMRLLLDFAKDKNIKTRSNNRNSSSLKEEMLRAIDRKGRTALHLAAQAGKVEPAGRILVENGAMLNPVDSFGGFTPLHLACLSDREPFACFLLDKGARLDCEDSAGRTPFQLAVLKGHIDTLTSLLQAPRPGESTDSILNQLDKQGRNSLHYAVESFASLQNKSKRGTTTEGSKRRSNDKEAEIEEESHNDDDDSPIVDPRRVIALLIQKGIALDARDRFGRTALHRAAWLGNSEVTKLLLDAYADRPALSNTVANEQQQLRASAIRAADNVTKATPLHVAAMRGHHEVLRLLMEPLLQSQKEGSSSSSWTKAQTRGHGVDVRDGMGRTPLHWAAYHGQEKCLRLLLEEDKSGAELTAKDLKGRTALHLACFGGHTHCVEQLLAYAKKEHASSPIASPTFDLTPTTVDLWKRRDLEGRLPIHMAAAGGHSDIIDILINNSNNNGEEEFLDDKGWSPLHYAALGGHQQCTDHLITLMHDAKQPQQTSVEKMDKEGKTPLMLAVIAACSGHGGLFFLSNSSSDGEKREQLQTKKRKKEGGNNVEEAVDEVVNNWYNRTKSVDAVQSRLEAIQETVKERRKKRMRKNKPNKEESNNGWRRAVSPRSKRSRLQSLFPQLDSIERLLQQGASLNRPSDKASKKTALHWGLQASLKNVNNNQLTMNGFRNLRQLLLLSNEKKAETNEEIEEERDRKELFDAYLAWKRKEQQADQETSEFEFIEASSSSISGNNSNSNSVEDELERYRAKVAQMEKALNEGEASEESEDDDDDDDEDKWKEWGEEVMQTIDELFNAIVLPSSTWLVCMEKLLKECETNNRVDLSLFDGEGKHVINWLNDKQAQLKIINNNKKRNSSSRHAQEQSGKDRREVERERKMETILKKETELEMMRLEQLIKDVRRRTAQMVLQKVNKKEEELAPKREQQIEEEIVTAKRSKEGQELGKAEQNGEEDVSSKRPRKEEKILHIFPSTEEEDEGKGKEKDKEEEKEGIETTTESEEETQEAQVDIMNTAMLFDTPEALMNVGWDKLEEGEHGEEKSKKEEEKRTSEQEITSKEEMEDEKEDEKEQEDEKEDENEIDAEKQQQEEEQKKKADSETKEEIKQTTDRDEEEIRKEEKEKQQKEEQERIDKEAQQKKIDEEEQRAKEAEQKAKAEQELLAQIDQQNEALLQQWERIKHQLDSLHSSSLCLLQQAQQQANTEKERLEEEDPRKRAEREVLELAKQKLLRRRAMRQRRAARRRAQQAKAQSNAMHWTVMIAVFLALWFVWCVVGGGGSGTGLQSWYSSSLSSSSSTFSSWFTWRDGMYWRHYYT